MEFKSLNGYLVKDEVAREQIEELGTNVSNVQAEVVDMKEESVQTKESILNLQKNMASVNESVANVNNLISDTNETILSIQRDVTTAVGSTQVLTSDVETLKTDNEEQKLDILTLKTNTSKNATDITTLNNDVTELNGKVENIKVTDIINDPTKLVDEEAIKNITPTNGVNYENYGNSYYYKVGTRVHVHFGVSGLTANQYVKLFTLPDGYRPYQAVTCVGTGEGATKIIPMTINNVGECVVYTDDQYCQIDCEFDAFN